MIVNDYYGQPYILWLANSILGSIAILEISKYLPAFLSFFGEHSLLMLMVHPYIKRLLLPVMGPTIWFYLIVVFVSTIVVYCLSKYLPITEGKYAINKKSI